MNSTPKSNRPPAARRIVRRALILLGTFAAPLASGCGGYSIREGVWELKFDDFTNVKNGQVLKVDPWTVKVSVAKREDPGDPEHIEDVEVTVVRAEPSSAPSSEQGKRLTRPEFFADIRRKEEGPTIFVVEKAKDGSWFFQMTGVVKDDETIVGQRVFGRVLFTSDATFQGRWSMRWLRDE